MLDGGPRQALLRMIDAAALRAADIVVVDTDEHLAALPARHRPRAVVVAVGAPTAWHEAGLAGQRRTPAPVMAVTSGHCGWFSTACTPRFRARR